MVDGINSNQSSEIYKKQNTSSTSSSSGVNSTSDWELKAQASVESWLANLPESSDEGDVTYDTTVEDLKKQLEELKNLQNTEPSGFEKGIQIASTLASGATQILSALNTGGDGSTSGPSNLESAMKACQADNPTQSDVTALNKYITKAENKLNKKLSDMTKNSAQLQNLQNSLASDIVKQERNIQNIDNALSNINQQATSVEVEIDGVSQQISANEEATGEKKTTIEKYAGAQQEGETKLSQLGRALTKANGDKDLKQAEINSLKVPNQNDYYEEQTVTKSDGTTETKKVLNSDKYEQAKKAYEDTKAEKERELDKIKNDIADLQSCIQVGNQTMAQIAESRDKADGELDMLLNSNSELKGNQDKLQAEKTRLKNEASNAQSSRTDAATAKTQTEQDKAKAEKELQKSREKLDELYNEKQQIDNAKAIRDAAQAKINGGTPSTTAKGNTGKPSTTTTGTPGATTTGTPSTTTPSTTSKAPNELSEVVVTAKRMANGETREATADDGTKVKITKVADGQYTVADVNGQVIKRGDTSVLEGYGFANLTP